MLDNFGLDKNGFKRKTYNDVLESMQTRTKELFGEDINFNTFSPIGMFLSAIAWEISRIWQALENSYLNGSALNAGGLALDSIVNNFGRKRFDGTKSIGSIKIVGNTGTIIDEGFAVGTKNGLIFKTTKQVIIPENGEVLAQIIAKDVGIKYNVPTGAITEIITPIAGVKEVVNAEPTTGGSDIETDEQLRIRHLLALREPTTGDNAAQYKIWAKEVKGVGNVKILPTTPSKGYVTIVITDSNNRPANAELINEVFEHIDKLRPVNAGIYIETAMSKPININANVTIADGYRIQDIQNRFIDILENYFTNIGLTETYVSYAQVGKLLLETKGIIDYDNLTINGDVANVELDNIEVPVLGDVGLEVI